MSQPGSAWNLHSSGSLEPENSSSNSSLVGMSIEETYVVGAEMWMLLQKWLDDFISIFADQNKARLCHHLFLHPEFHLHRDVLGKKPKKKLRGVSLRRFCSRMYYREINFKSQLSSSYMLHKNESRFEWLTQNLLENWDSTRHLLDVSWRYGLKNIFLGIKLFCFSR